MLADSSDHLAAAEAPSTPSENALAVGSAEGSAGGGEPASGAPGGAPLSGARAGRWRPGDVLAALADHPRGDDLARLVHAAAFAAADERRTTFVDGLGEMAERAGLKRGDAETPYGNVLRALERSDGGPAGSAERALVGGALARGVALMLPSGIEAEQRVAETLVWLAAHTFLDAFLALDAALGASAEGLWRALAQVVRRVDAGELPRVGRAEMLVAAAALVASDASVARSEVSALAAEVRDPVVRTLVAGAHPSAGLSASLRGEIVPAPRGPIALALLGVTGILAALHLGRLFARLALRYAHPTDVRISSAGITLVSHVELLGRVLRERETRIPLEGLARATREVRYPRLAMYVGLLALALGSYFGVSYAVDGIRAGSFELVAVGALLVAIGVALDYVLVSLVPKRGGRCVVVFLPRRGRAIAVGSVDPARADAALAGLGAR